MIDSKKKSFAIASLRRASYRWVGRYSAFNGSKVGRNQYKCEMCPEDVVHGRKDVQLDHRIPIVPVEGWDGFDNYIDRLFVEKEGFAVLCKPHHKEKTVKENAIRKENRKKK
jgi:hypothetical protein